MVDVLHFGNEDYYFDTVNTYYSPTAIKYIYGRDKEDKEKKDPEWKTAQNFSDEDWKKFCEEEQMEDPPSSSMNGRYYSLWSTTQTGTTVKVSG